MATTENSSDVERAKAVAVEVLLHNMKGPYHGLPRTAGWGYPEPYTRDLMIGTFGILVTGNNRLIKSQRRVLETVAENQSPKGHIPSLIHDPEDRGASDTTPLFILAASIFGKETGEPEFLRDSIRRAQTWMSYQSPDDRSLIAQLPTSDWRDEQWVLGYGLFVNTVVYSYLRYLGQKDSADSLRELLSRSAVRGGAQQRHVHEGLRMPNKPYYLMWSYKIHSSERFDLLGNSLAILSGIASPSRSDHLIRWIEAELTSMTESRYLSVDLPPNFFPFIMPDDPDWRPRYAEYNRPGEYHNGGVWPFVCGFYVAALVAAGRYRLAEERLQSLTRLVRPAREAQVEFGFNEWIRAQDGLPSGHDWQSWSASMYLYAADCVERRRTPFFDRIRNSG